MLDNFIYVVGVMTIAAVASAIGVFIILFLEKIIKDVMCHHIYEPQATIFSNEKDYYKFVCGKCGKAKVIEGDSKSKFKFRLVEKE